VKENNMKRINTQLVLLASLVSTLAISGCQHPATSREAGPMSNVIVAGQPGKFCGWPANNGVWTFDGGREILVGFSRGAFDEREGHNTSGQAEPANGIDSLLARSRDGGRTWVVEDPENFVGDGAATAPAPGGIRFSQPGFALRAEGVGYHGSDAPQGRFFYSTDRGHNWRGPFQFTGLMDDSNMREMDCTTRTGYLVTGRDSCLIFMSARLKKNGGGRDKTFVAETTDGGKTFHFVSWVVPLSDPHRAVMPAVARLKDGTIVAALRRRIPGDDRTSCWVDAYGSKDNGRTWTFLSRVGDTGTGNGNPPALVALNDGRLACAYGDRSRVKMLARLSGDGGRTWGEEIVVRDDFQPDKFGDKDFGYPRLVQNDKGELAAMYYWATKDHFQQHIAATVWRP
jgi:hypothetical protein